MTGDKRTNFADRRHLPQERFQAGFFDYLADELLGIAHHLWGSRRGVFGVAEFDGDGANAFKVDNLPKELLDGDGYILAPTTADATAIAVQNTLGVAYYVGTKHCLIPSGVTRNPRTGLFDYDLLEDRLGVVADPDSVVEGAGVLTITVDSVFEAGVSHAGRHVTVWLRSPRSGLEAVAIERDLVVAYVGGFNVITTSGLLGQPGGSSSTVPADYQVAATGITVRRNTDLRAEAAYAFLTILTGTGGAIGPADFNSANQVDVTAGLTPTLDTAYDGSLGSGSGRAITVDSGAVEINANGASAGDVDGAALRVNRLDSTEDGGLAAELIGVPGIGVTRADLRPLQTAGGELLPRENCTILAGGHVELTRGGAQDLTLVGLNPAVDLARVDGTPTSDGLYLLHAVVDAQHATLHTRDGAAWAPAPGESGEVSFLRAVSWSADPGFASAAARSEGLQGVCSAGGNAGGAGSAAHRFFPCSDESSAAFFDDADPPVARSRATEKGHLQTRELHVTPDHTDDDIPDPEEGIGLILDAFEHLRGTAGDPEQGAFPGAWLGNIKDPSGSIPIVFTPYGHIALPHYWREDFNFFAANWALAVSCPMQFKATVTGGGANGNVKIKGGVAGAGGILEIIAPDQATDFSSFDGPDSYSLDTDDFLHRWAARCAIKASHAAQFAFVGMMDSSGTWKIGFYRSAPASTHWKFFITDGVNTIEVDTGIDIVAASTQLNKYFMFVDADHVVFWLQGMVAPLTLQPSLAAPAAISFSAHPNAWNFRAEVMCTSNGTNPSLELDLAVCWDDQALHGLLGRQHF